MLETETGNRWCSLRGSAMPTTSVTTTYARGMVQPLSSSFCCRVGLMGPRFLAARQTAQSVVFFSAFSKEMAKASV